MLYIIIFISLILLSFYVFLFFLESKINALENKIISIFRKRTGVVPSLFDLTKNKLNRHDEIFKDILTYKKVEFSQINYDEKLSNIIKNESLIHNELNFIFKVCNKHKSIGKDARFLYIRDIIIEQSYELGKYINLYRNIIKTFNKYINIKNITLIGIIVPLQKKDVI